MMINLVGQKFGRLTVQEFVGMGKHSMSWWICLCDCGNTKRIRGGALKSGNTKSCGCLKREQTTGRLITHGQSRIGLVTLVYGVWRNMMQRCYNPKHRDYRYWGGRGIRVCERWHSFENFYEDMGNPPEGMTLDRKDNSGDYCKENCRWATKEEQQNNTRYNVWLEHEGERRTIAQWAREIGMNVGTLGARLNVYGWSIERALTTPVRRCGRI